MITYTIRKFILISTAFLLTSSLLPANHGSLVLKEISAIEEELQETPKGADGFLELSARLFKLKFYNLLTKETFIKKPTDEIATLLAKTAEILGEKVVYKELNSRLFNDFFPVFYAFFPIFDEELFTLLRFYGARVAEVRHALNDKTLLEMISPVDQPEVHALLTQALEEDKTKCR